MTDLGFDPQKIGAKSQNAEGAWTRPQDYSNQICFGYFRSIFCGFFVSVNFTLSLLRVSERELRRHQKEKKQTIGYFTRWRVSVPRRSPPPLDQTDAEERRGGLDWVLIRLSGGVW